MSISQKKGQCVDCVPGPDKPLIAGRCQTHYWQYRAKVKVAARKGSEIDIDKEAQQRAEDLWYVTQIQQLPRHCENCGEYLNPYAPWGAKTYVAHIVAKRNFKSVCIHPLNRIFLCVICHTNYDNWSEAKVEQMPVISLCMERFAQFSDNITRDEWRYLPGWLVDKANYESA